MKLYVCESDKIIEMKLPQQIDGSFLFTYKSSLDKVENSLSIDSEDGKWKLKSNGNINIMINNEFVDNIILEEYKFMYLANILENKYVPLYCLPTYDNNSLKYVVNNQIRIGKSQDNEIIYNQTNIEAIHATISNNNDNWIIQPISPKASVYINKKKINAPTKLNIGDIIFIDGLKIIWMKQFIKVNNPNNLVRVNLKEYNIGLQIDNNSYTPVTELEASKDLYEESDYFYHTPQIKQSIELQNIKIDTPPNNQNKEDDLPVFLSIGTSFTLVASSAVSLYNIVYGLTTKTKTVVMLIPNIIMCTAMLIGSVIVPKLIKRYQRKRASEKEAKRQTKYKEYLETKEKNINQILEEQKNVMLKNNLSGKDCENMVLKGNGNFWNREIKEPDFLKIRVGLGTTEAEINIESPEEHFTLDDDNLYTAACKIKEKYKYLEKVPTTINLVENSVTAIIEENRTNYIDGIIMQLITLQSAQDLKIVLLTNKEKEQEWNYMKYLPHCFSESKEMRFFCTTGEEYKQINTFLEQEYLLRNPKVEDKPEKKDEKKYANYSPYYLIITDNFADAKNMTFIETQLKDNNNSGFSLMILDSDMKNLPPECKKFIYVTESEGVIFNSELEKNETKNFEIEKDAYNLEIVAKKLANIPIKTKEAESTLPTSLSFLEMYNVGKIEQLNITNRWRTNNPTISLQTPIGVHKNTEIFNLDLHEKKDGPHGLIAGSTGSGKSEFIITYVLSMAVNFHPDEVQFVLIDYKGGGLAGAFENKEANIQIPHLAGTITNLDGPEMNRSLVSIESELKKRQQIFNEAKAQHGESTMDIYKYQKLYREGAIKEPISHLIIICDEFAELKAQQPDFMSQLISISRIGRSLGVHLILATQKPSGVVNDQIWANSKFKVCLKVQTRSDSMEMLKRPEASSIKETGRFYLQVGYDEYFDIGQSAWTGANYIPTDRIIKKQDDTLIFIDNIGNAIKTINDVKSTTVSEEKGDQLTNIVKYLNDIAIREKIVPRKLWLPSLNPNIYINDLIKKYEYKLVPNEYKSIIGEYDSPVNQKQGLLTLDHLKNTIIYGLPGSGKENLLQTIIYTMSLCYSTNNLNIYIGDFGSEVLKIYKDMPQVGDYITINDSDKITGLIKMLEKELENRKRLYSDYGGNFIEYNKQKNDNLLIITILNNIENFMETYPRLADEFDTLIRDGVKYGIAFIITTSVNNSVKHKTAQYFENKICMKLANDTDYLDLVNAPRGLTPAKFFGRGLVSKNDKALEFQTAYICEQDNYTKYIKEFIENRKQNNKKAKSIPILPKVVYVEDIENDLDGLENIPIGIEKNSLESCLYDFTKNKTNLILSNVINNHIYFLYAINNMMSKIKDTKIKVIDLKGIYKSIYPNTTVYNKDFDSAILNIYQEIRTQKDYKGIYVFVGIGEILNKVTKANYIYIEEIFKTINKTEDIIIIADDYEKIKNIQTEEWYSKNIDNTYGIWLGEGIGTQTAISVMSLSIEDKKEIFPCISFPIYQGYHMIVKYVVDGVEKQDEE